MITPTITSFNATFYNCRNLKKSPVTDVTAEGTGNVDLYRMFYGANSLQEIPNWDFSRVWRMRECFNACSSVSGGIDNLNLDLNNQTVSTDVNNFHQPFTGCSIKYVNQMSTPESGTLSYFFNNCYEIVKVPDMNLSGVSNTNYMFNETRSLLGGVPSGLETSISYYRSTIPSGEIVRFFNGLASGVTSKTIDLRQAPEAYILTSDDIAIATSKGWTVTT